MAGSVTELFQTIRDKQEPDQVSEETTPPEDKGDTTDEEKDDEPGKQEEKPESDAPPTDQDDPPPADDKQDPPPDDQDGKKGTKAERRIRKLVSERNARDQQIKALEDKVNKLLQQQTEPPSKKPEPKDDDNGDDWLDNLLGEDDSSQEPDPQQAAYNDRLLALETRTEAQRLRAEISTVREKYPECPPALLLKATMQDGNANLMNVAETYQAFIDDVRSSGKGDDSRSQEDPPKKPGIKRPGVSSGGTRTTKGGKDNPLNQATSVRDLFDRLRRAG